MNVKKIKPLTWSKSKPFLNPSGFDKMCEARVGKLRFIILQFDYKDDEGKKKRGFKYDIRIDGYKKPQTLAQAKERIEKFRAELIRTAEGVEK